MKNGESACYAILQNQHFTQFQLIQRPLTAEFLKIRKGQDFEYGVVLL